MAPGEAKPGGGASETSLTLPKHKYSYQWPRPPAPSHSLLIIDHQFDDGSLRVRALVSEEVSQETRATAAPGLGSVPLLQPLTGHNVL